MFALYNTTLNGEPEIGQQVYLIDVQYQSARGRDHVMAQNQPGAKNSSGEPCANGWLGTTDNVSRTAIGMGVVTGIFWPRDKNGVAVLSGPARLRVRRIK